MRPLFISVAFMAMLCISLPLSAQGIAQGLAGEKNDTNSSYPNIFTLSTPELDLHKLAAEDQITDGYLSTSYRFGVEHEVNLDMFDHATSYEANGLKHWKMRVSCPDALLVSFIFSDINLDEQGTFLIRSVTGEELSYTSQDLREHLATALVDGPELTLVYSQSSLSKKTPQMRLEKLIHGYRPLVNKWKGPFGESNTCHQDVACASEIDRRNRHSVGLIVSGGEALCTGSLIANTIHDARSLFLTANHCIGQAQNWVIYFGHESKNECTEFDDYSYVINGAKTLATASQVDLKLMELHGSLPRSLDIALSGWRVNLNQVNRAQIIHHPLGDYKKVAYEDDPVIRVNYGTDQEAHEGGFWMINHLDRQTMVEPVSSGSPLFFQGKIIGALSHGNGEIHCGNKAYFGVLEEAWDAFAPYLDPLNSGVKQCDGMIRRAAGGAYYSADTEAEEIKLWPNPAEDQLHVLYNMEHEGPLEIEIRDLLGRSVKHFSMLANQHKNEFSFSIRDLEMSHYLLVINGISTHRFHVVH